MIRARMLPWLLGAALLAGCASVPSVPIPDQDAQPIRFLAYRVVHNAADHLALEIQYSYDGSEGDGVFVGAISTQQGRSTGHWGYRPDPVYPGTHWARVRLGLSDTAPRRHRTDGIELSIYRGGGPTLHEVSVPFKKLWLKPPGGSQCHLDWGAGCDG